jgi:N-methylhydantoinase B
MTDRSVTFDPIALEVLRNALEATAQEMGGVLKLTSFSPNIKERMDAWTPRAPSSTPGRS